jgi:regulator of replication initiation timing
MCVPSEKSGLNVPLSVLDRGMSRKPHDKGPRIILIPGNWVTRPAARDFLERGRFHVDQSKRSNYEALCVVEKLRKLDAVDGNTQVNDHGAIFQTFRGTGDIEASHTLTTTFTLDEVFLHQVKQSGGKENFNKTFQRLTILLQGDVTYAPWLFNRLDSVLGGAKFKKLFLQSIKSVMEGESAKNAIQELTRQRQKVLGPLAEVAREQNIEITLDEALRLLNQGIRKSTEESDAYTRDSESLENLVQMYKQGIQICADREAIPVKAIGGDEIEHKVDSQDWTKADEPGASETKA